MPHDISIPTTSPRAPATIVERCLLRTVDAGLAGCILVAPLFLGGRHPVGQLLLVGLAVFVALTWAARACLAKETVWRISGAELILLAAIGLLVLQLVPLPERMLHWLSPHLSEILPLWSSDSSSPLNLGSWHRISLTPTATVAGLVMLLAYSMLFWVTVQRLQEVEDIQRLLRWCAWGVLAMAGLGLMQWLVGNGKFLWFYDAPLSNASDAAKGSFTNRNHFAHFLALGIGAMIWWIEDARSRRQQRSVARRGPWSTSPTAEVPLRWLGLGIVLFAGLLSLSRGGVAVMLLAAAVMTLACYRARVLGIRFVAASLGIAAVVAVALAIHGHDMVGQRMDDLVSGSVDTLDPGQRRRIIWSADLRAVGDFAVLGAGVGSHRCVCPMYLDPERLPGYAALANRIYFTHAENGPLQVALESGLSGLALLLSGIGLVGYWCLSTVGRSSSRRVLLAIGAVGAALSASLAHGMVDFVWYVPACTAILAILAGVACRLHQITVESHGGRSWQWSVRPRHNLLAVVVLMLLGGWMLGNRWGPALASSHWDSCQRLAHAPVVDTEPPARNQEIVIAPAGSEVPSLGTTTPNTHPLETPLETIIAELEETVRLDPTHREARLQLAGTYLLLFECLQQRSATNAMPLSAIREAVMASGFASRAELDIWLKHAVGEHSRYLDLALMHTRRALRQCPLEGTAYLYLGELVFLEGVGSRQAIHDGVAQALRVRPHDGGVLVSAGQEAAMAGSLEQALGYWQRAYRLGPAYQKLLVRRLAGHVCPDHPALELDFFLDTFGPGLTVVRQLEEIYRGRATETSLARLRDLHARLAQAEAKRSAAGGAACRLWMEARLAHVRRGRTTEALDCLGEAVRRDPNHATARLRLAKGLLIQKQYNKAKTHFQWCLARNPKDKSLQRALRKCTEGGLNARKRATLTRSDKNQWR